MSRKGPNGDFHDDGSDPRELISLLDSPVLQGRSLVSLTSVGTRNAVHTGSQQRQHPTEVLDLCSPDEPSRRMPLTSTTAAARANMHDRSISDDTPDRVAGNAAYRSAHAPPVEPPTSGQKTAPHLLDVDSSEGDCMELDDDGEEDSSTPATASGFFATAHRTRTMTEPPEEVRQAKRQRLDPMSASSVAQHLRPSLRRSTMPASSPQLSPPPSAASVHHHHHHQQQQHLATMSESEQIALAIAASQDEPTKSGESTPAFAPSSPVVTGTAALPPLPPSPPTSSLSAAAAAAASTSFRGRNSTRSYSTRNRNPSHNSVSLDLDDNEEGSLDAASAAAANLRVRDNGYSSDDSSVELEYVLTGNGASRRTTRASQRLYDRTQRGLQRISSNESDRDFRRMMSRLRMSRVEQRRKQSSERQLQEAIAASNRLVRDEQDQEYYKSLQEDQAKEQQKRLEKQRQEEEDRLKQAIALSAKEAAVERRKAAQDALTPEPAAGTPGITTIALKLPAFCKKRRAQRRFPPDVETAEAVFRWVETMEELEGRSWQLVLPMGHVVLDRASNLEQKNLSPRGLIIVKADDDDDE